MDVNLDELLVLLQDPSTKDETVARLKEHVEVLRDENGETCRIIPLKDAVFMENLLSLIAAGNGINFHDIRNLAIRDDDIIVCDQAKSGTHWLCNLIHFMIQDGPLSEKLSFQPPLLELISDEIVEKIPSPRIMTTHQLPKSIPQEIFTKHTKVILLYRNPKDTVTSLYYHLKRMRRVNYNLSWNCHVENWMKGRVSTIDFFDYYNAWEKVLLERKDLKVLLLSYEDMKKTPMQELKKVSEYLGHHLDEVRLQEIINKCSLESLKNDVESGAVKSPLVDQQGKSILYRKGIIGDWKNHFTVAQSEQMDAVVKTKIGQSSVYKFQYT